MDILPISYKTKELKYYDPALTTKLHDAGFVYAEDLAYRSVEYLGSRLSDVLDDEEMKTLMTSLVEHITLLRVRSITEDTAKSIQEAHVGITSLPYMNESHLASITGLATEDVLRIQRDTVTLLKSGKMVVSCTDEQGNALTGITISIAYPTEEMANRHYVFHGNDAGDVFLENIRFGAHDLYIDHQGNAYKHRVTITPEMIYRYQLVLNDYCKHQPIDEFLSGMSSIVLPTVSRVISLDEIREGEDFRIVRLGDGKATLLANHRLQDACTWALRNISLARSNFDFELRLYDPVVFRGGGWHKG